MSKSHKRIFKMILASGVIGCMGLSSVFAGELKLRSSIDTASPEIQLKGGVKIDSHNHTISLSLRDSDLRQVLRMLADKAGYNLVLQDSVKGTVTVDLNRVPLNKAFEYILTLNKLSYWQDGNTLIVTTADDANSLGLNKSKVKPIKIKYVDAGVVASFLNKNIFSLNKPNGNTKPSVVINPNTNEIMIFGNDGDIVLAQKVIKYLDVKPESRTYEVDYAPTADIANIICSSVFGATGAAAVSATPPATPENKIACSANPTSITADNLESLNTKGYQVYYNESLRKITIYGGTQEQISQVADVIKKFDKKQQQVYIEVSIIELSESGSKALSSTWAFQSGRFAIDAGVASSIDDSTTAKSWAGTIGMAKGSNGGYIWKGSHPNYSTTLTQYISMLLTQNKGRLLANPRIIAINNQKSTIDITTEYLDKRTKTVQATSTTNQPLVSTDYTKGSAGIQIDITPKITPNGYINLDLNPSYTQPGEQVKEGDDIVLTFINTRKLDLKDIRVKDGETLVLGGLIQEKESNSQQKIPILADIPVLGMFFKASASDKSRSELIIMVTPKIVKENDSEDTL